MVFNFVLPLITSSPTAAVCADAWNALWPVGAVERVGAGRMNETP